MNTIDNQGETSGSSENRVRPSRMGKAHRPLRVWPTVLLVVAMVCLRYGPGFVEGGLSKFWMLVVFGPLVCSVIILIWWLTASRATGRERLFGVCGILGALVSSFFLMHPSMGVPGLSNYGIPLTMAAFALGLVVNARRSPMQRTGVALLLAVAGCGFCLLFRSEGMRGDYSLGLRWRWTPSAEQLMIAGGGIRGGGGSTHASPIEMKPEIALPEWPGFRGSDRAGRQQGPVIAADWNANPPEQLWKIAVGPGWGSFAVAGERLFTQEQRGSVEVTVCYHAGSGREIWTQQVEARLEDPLGGPGPRATPSLSEGKLFVTGSTGWFLCLDAVTGGILWKQQLQAVAERDAPMWGFSASPLVVDSLVVVYAGGGGDKGVLAFDVSSGELRWSAAAEDSSYSSPQLNTIVGERLVLMMSGAGLRMLDSRTGNLRLNYEWATSGYRAVQPKVIDGDTVLIPTGANTGTRAIRVSKDGAALSSEELWTSRQMKPDFSDFVIYEGNAYCFDGGIFASINLRTGDRNWKGGRYGKGQVLLLESSGLLLIVSEQGEVVLVKADPSKDTQLASFKALEGKTWNHPVVVGNRLYVRNSQEAACYRLPLAGPHKVAASSQ